MNDVFTLAHEAGHAMHSFYADANLPFHEAGYPIFLAEIASTVNEVLLTWSLLEQTPKDDVLRAGLRSSTASPRRIYGTVVRQTMFAEYEQRVHALAESGTPLTLDVLNDIYGELYETYLPGVAVDDGVRVNWARIPHFYRAFYVYQYATGTLRGNRDCPRDSRRRRAGSRALPATPRFRRQRLPSGAAGGSGRRPDVSRANRGRTRRIRGGASPRWSGSWRPGHCYEFQVKTGCCRQ